MKYVQQEISGFTATNLTDTYNEWSPSTAYSFESGTPTNASIARYGTWYYRSVTNGNLNHNPEDTEGVYWTKWDASNKYGMLDLKSQTYSRYNGGNLTVTFLQNGIDTLGFGNYTAFEIYVEILDTDGTTVLWSYTTPNTYYNHIYDWYTFTQIGYADVTDKATMVNLPLQGKYVRVTFIKSNELTYTQCGFMLGGQGVYMGDTLTNIKFNFNSYAVKEIDSWGSLNITKRAVQDLIDFETMIDTNRLMSFKRKIKSVYNDIVMFVIDESENSEFENIINLGIIQDANVVLNDFDKTILTFSVMESI